MIDYKKGSVGRRAAREIRELTWRENILLSKELNRLGFTAAQHSAWENGLIDPSARSLNVMGQCGYDVNYIVMGVRDRC